jgi:Na+-driven multidrug efflux pump
MRTAIVLGLGLGLAVMVWHLTCVGGLLTALQTPAEAIPSAAAYVTVRAIGFPFGLINTALWGICAGRNDPITPLLTSLMSVVVNVVVRMPS